MSTALLKQRAPTPEPLRRAADTVTFPRSAIAVGLSGPLAEDARRELGAYPLPVTGEFADPDAAIAAFRESQSRPQIVLTHFRSRADEVGLRRLNGALAGWPVVALVDLQADPENLLWANRAGAAQLVPLPLDPPDLRAALDAVGVQFNLTPVRARTIAFTPACGGCGASTLAAAAAHEIATQLGRKTLLIEITPQMGTLATNLNLTPAATLSDLIHRVDDLDRDALQKAVTVVGGNLSVIPGPNGMMPAGWLSRRRVLKLVALARTVAEVVVLDVPSLFDGLQFDLVNSADYAALICQQNIASLRALRLLLDSLGPARAGGTHLVLNMFDPAIQGFSVEDIQWAMGVTQLVAVTRDTPAVVAAVNRGQSLRQVAPDSPVLKSVSELLGVIIGGGRW